MKVTTIDELTSVCENFFTGDWESYKDFIPSGFHLPVTVEKYYRIPVYKGSCLVILMLWGPHARTAIHDHGGARGAVKVLKGALREDRYRFDGIDLELQDSAIHHPGAISRVEDNDIHAVSNEMEEMSVSLHIYHPAIDSLDGTRIFDPENRRIGTLNHLASRATWCEKPESFSTIERY